MQVKERLNVLGGIPRQVFAGASALGDDPIAEIERAVVNLKWDELISGFAPEAVGSPDTASHRLLVMSAPNRTSGEPCSLVVNSTTVMC